MRHHRLLSRSCTTAIMAILQVVSIVTVGRGSFQAAEKSAAVASQDPFDVAEKAAEKSTVKEDEKSKEKKAEPEFVRKTPEEWAKILNPAVFRVTRWKETEPPFSGKYATGHYRGTFICACCDADLFNADHKFDSGTGWPSFWRPVSTKAIVNAIDNSEAERRIEVMCRRCGAHLGHVFDDNPAAPTGLRYCINSLALKLKAPDGSAAKTASVKGKARTTVKTRSKDGSKTAPSKAAAKSPTPAPQASSDSKSEE